MLERLIKWWYSWDFDPTGGEESRKATKAAHARVNCIHLFPPKNSIPRPHCETGTGVVGDCPIYLGKSTECSFKALRVKPLTHSEILARVEEKEWETRCVDNDICPYCGKGLEITDDGKFLDQECFTCHKSWPCV